MDRRATEIRHLNLTYTFPAYRTKEEWLKRAEGLRRQILVSAGLWPTPPKGELNAQVFGKVDRGDYTMEKVYFESFPGFYVTGNLYRPKGKTGKLPAVLCPHGHWSYGRLENTDLNSGPSRAANFARQGYVAFLYDMVGYNDSAAINHRHVGQYDALWGMSILGLQLWNSIRSADFLLSLPEVDPERLACTGESGGGTQTFLLMAVDDRIKVAAPVNMISSHMQGGDVCENAPNLRVDTYNVEFGAMMAPRPLLMVSATGDWTKNTLSVEYPAIRSIYRLFGAEDKVHAVQMNAPHNYNKDSREAVYGWFAHWLLGRAESGPLKEKSGGVASLPEQLVFFGLPRPDNELNEDLLSQSLVQMAKQQLEEARPRDAASLGRFRERFGVALKYSLMAEYPRPEDVIASAAETKKTAEATVESLFISRRGRGDRVAVILWTPAQHKAVTAVKAAKADGSAVLLVHPDLGASGTAASSVSNLAKQFASAGHTVLEVFCFPGGVEAKLPSDIKFFTTYNRTDDANRVQDILTALAYLNGRQGNAGMSFVVPGQAVELRGLPGGTQASAGISVVAPGRAGLWALLARGLAPKIDRMAVDAAQFDNTSDEAFLKTLPIPGLRRAGDFFTAAAIAPLTPLLIHNTGGKFRTDWTAEVYQSLGRGAEFRAQAEPLTDAALITWLSASKP